MSIASESEIDRIDVKSRMTFEQRQALELKKQNQSKLSKVTGEVALVVTAVFLLSLYFCAMKMTTLLSKELSVFEIMYHRSLWGLIILVFY